MAKTLSCSHCPSKSEDLDANPKAWNGWQITPPAVCPDCISKGLAAKGFEIVHGELHGKHIEMLVFRGNQA